MEVFEIRNWPSTPFSCLITEKSDDGSVDILQSRDISWKQARSSAVVTRCSKNDQQYGLIGLICSFCDSILKHQEERCDRLDGFVFVFCRFAKLTYRLVKCVDKS